MNEKIQLELAKLSCDNSVDILLVVESGSRAWGFHSQNSDYDVRYVYARRAANYVSVFPVRDVIEGPADDVLDFSGWDLKKALGLLYKSNPCLFEWMQSPIVYRETELGTKFRELAKDYFQPIPAMHHYLSMCKHNYREHMRNGAAPSVRLKKYLYITRPLLCCRWIERNGTVPPMRMEEMMEKDFALSSPVELALRQLIAAKRAGNELDEGAAIPALNKFIDSELERLSFVIPTLPKKQVDPKRLDAFLRCAVL